MLANGYFYALNAAPLSAPYLREVYSLSAALHALPLATKRAHAKPHGGPYSGGDVGVLEEAYEAGTTATVRAFDFSRVVFASSEGGGGGSGGGGSGDSGGGGSGGADGCAIPARDPAATGAAAAAPPGAGGRPAWPGAGSRSGAEVERFLDDLYGRQDTMGAALVVRRDAGFNHQTCA
jgi:hypothetical protein